ncbi:MAG: protease modulator HflC [Firmicutes bacterium]|nr:protease modulator HflC [Bacillota bacterium]
MNKSLLKTLLPVLILIIAVIAIFSCTYVVQENEYACVVRFSAIVETRSNAGLYFRIPFVDQIKYYNKATNLYDLAESEVLTADKKNMTVNSYILWKISDPKTFYQTLGSTGEAEARLDVLTYNSLKNTMGTLQQTQIINPGNTGGREDLYLTVTREVAEAASVYGIEVVDVKVKRLDLPEDNEAAVYQRMISERNQQAEKFIADGEYQASLIRNEVDKQVNITISDAEVQAAQTIASGEEEYMKILAEAYNTKEKQDFYEFTKALETLSASLDGQSKTVILGKDSELVRLLMGQKE